MDCGELVDAACRSPRCVVCGPREAFKLAAAVSLAEPERLITLTLVGDTWQERRPRLRRLFYELRREFGPMEWSWSCEPNPEQTGFHVHACQYGPARIPQRRLSQLAASEGMGRVVDIRRLDRAAASSMYLVKMAADAYGMKQATRPGEREAFLEANGGRQLLHTSRGFWRDGGVPIAGSRPRRVAVQRAMERLHGRGLCRHVWSPKSRKGGGQ